MGTCPKCKKPFGPDVKFCPDDGGVVDHGNKPTAPPKKSTLPQELLANLPPAPEAGWVIDGKYRLEKKLGEGGMGAVWKATHEFMSKPVALKLLKSQVASSDEAVKRFAREAKLASQFDEPHCVQLFDCGRDEKSGILYLAMEYLEGRSLRGLLDAEKRVPVDRAVGIITQLLAALDAAHDIGIVHRDVKPENIFLVSHGKRKEFVKLLDFGIAKQPPTEDYKTQITRAGFTVGTPEYISPEQAFAQDVDGRADLYAVGIIFYEMIVGRRPFIGNNALEVITAHVQQPPPPPRKTAPDANIPEEIEKVLLKAIAKEPNDRYPDAEAFANALQAALPAKGITASIINAAPATTPSISPSPSLNTVQTGALAPAPSWMRPAFYGLLILSGFLLLGFLLLLLSSAQAQPKKPKANPTVVAPVFDLKAVTTALQNNKTAEALSLLQKNKTPTPESNALLAWAYAQNDQWKEATTAAAKGADKLPPELLTLAIAAVSQDNSNQDAIAVVKQVGKKAIPVLNSAAKTQQRPAAILLLGEFAATEPSVVGWLVNALAAATECADRVALVNALANAPAKTEIAITQIMATSANKKIVKACASEDLLGATKAALKRLE
jgi:serine/threonine protein kinase